METATDRQAIEHAKCIADPAYFIDTYLVIDDTQGHGDGTGTMRFALWPAQTRLAWDLAGNRLTIILKARQLGISWLVMGYVLWVCMFERGKSILLLSQGDLEAQELLRRVKVLYDRLPDWLRLKNPYAKEPNVSTIHWANGSVVRSLPATRKAGRSFTASLVVMDECAFMQWADQLYTALKPVVDGGGQLVILSTSDGMGNLFHRLWVKAVAGGNQFKSIFLPWWSRPGRDLPWYGKIIAEADDLVAVKREYPADATEAFQNRAGLVFPNFESCVVPDFEYIAGERVGGIDYGFHNPFAAIPGTLDHDGVLWISAERYQSETPISEHAKHMPKDVNRWYADPAGADQTAELRQVGFPIFPCVHLGGDSIQTGVDRINNRIRKGTLKVAVSCVNLRREASLYHYDPTKMTEKPVDRDNHALSALRYLCVGIDRLMAVDQDPDQGETGPSRDGFDRQQAQEAWNSPDNPAFWR